ncbi:unnamed protein product [Mucor hiemalis]
MYNNYHHGQPVPSLPLPQQQSLYFITPVHHNYHSLPPPPRFFVPSQVVMQQYHDSYEEKRSRKTLHSHDMNRNRSSSDKRRTLSDTTTLTGMDLYINYRENEPTFAVRYYNAHTKL